MKPYLLFPDYLRDDRQSGIGGPHYNEYRMAKLFFKPPKAGNDLEIKRVQADNNAVKRGTLQHEVLEGEAASVYKEDDNIAIWVNYMDKSNNSTAQITDLTVPYALAVTLRFLRSPKNQGAVMLISPKELLFDIHVN